MAAQPPLQAINGALRDQLFGLKARKLRQNVKSVSAPGVGLAMETPPELPDSADVGQQLPHLFADLLQQPGAACVLRMLEEVHSNAGRNTKSRLQPRALFPIFSHQLGNRPADLEAFVGHFRHRQLGGPGAVGR